MIGNLLGRFGLAARIGLSISAAVIAIQALVTAVFLFTPENPPQLYEARWLSDTIAEIARQALSGAPVGADFLERLPGADALSVRIDSTPRQTVDPPWPLNRVLATVRRELVDVRPAAISAFVAGPRPFLHSPLAIVPPSMAATLSKGPILPEDELLVPPLFLIAVDLGNGRWLTIAPREHEARGRLIRSLAFFAGTALIGVIAAFTSQGLVAPLGALAVAADRLGRGRETTDIPRPAIRELAAIHDAFEAMQRRLKRFVDERTHMLAAISHDLRTPLARLRLQAEFIADKDQRADMLDNIAAMQDMLAETVAFAAGDASSEAADTFDLASILISICDEATDAGARTEYAGPDHARLSGRRTAIRRVLSNLIENAVRYGGVARVALHRGAQELIVTISDDGPGIPQEMFEKAFAPFQRLETSRNRESGGTGLGLSIARDIVLAHGGQIALSDAVSGSQGLLVTVSLPSEPAAVRRA